MKLVSLLDDRLYSKCIAVINPKSLSIKMLKDSMTKLMLKHKGIGLSTPQVGRTEAMFIMFKDNKVITCINPTISWQSDDIVEFSEGCLSFPNKFIKLYRPSKIIAEYTDLKGCRIVEKMSGIHARCYQHELDHLSGITFIHRQDEQKV